MQMRAGGAAGLADMADQLSPGDAVAFFHQTFGLMQIAGGDALAVIDQGEAAIQIVIIADADHARGRHRQHQ